MTKAPLSIAILGAGNVAWHLSQAFKQAGHHIITVYSRTLARAEFLAEALQQAQPTHLPDFSNTKADLFLVAVKDDAVTEVLQKAVFPPGSLVAHTSGSLPLGIFSEYTQIRGGVFYPLQTFSQGQVLDLKYTPIGVEGTTPTDTDLLLSLAASISERSLQLASAERQIIHLAAVFACNFSNHLLGISQQLLAQHQLHFNLLQPLVTETIRKSFANIPFRVQTGPAVRSDENTLNQHRYLLQNQPGYLAVYNVLTQSIQRQVAENPAQEPK